MKLKGKVIASITTGVISGLIGGLSLVYSYYSNLSLDSLKFDLNQSTTVLDREGRILDEIHGDQHRKIVSLDKIDKDIQQAVIAIEDKNFYKHNGVSFSGIGRAAISNIKSGSTKEGASTITMQLAKNLKDNVDERTLSNKILEAMLAIKLENALTKQEILELYLNTIYWGNNTNGIEAATNTYFGKSSADVTPSQAAFLAAMIQNPSRYNIYSSNKESYPLVKARQKEVLRKIGGYNTNCYSNKELYPSKQQRINCINQWANQQSRIPLVFTGKTTWQKSTEGYVSDMAIQEAIDILPKVDSIEDLQIGGYKIYTTVNKKHQELARNSVDNYKGYKNGAQFAFVAIDPNTNKVIATVGGTDYNKSALNRTLGHSNGLEGRQPGSSIKPYVYYEAMKKYNPEDQIDDRPFCMVFTWGKPYCPKNYGGDFVGLDSLQNHLAKSRNIPAVILGQDVGINRVIRTMRKLGITTTLENTPSFPLGSNNLIPIEHANAFAAFANGGKYSKYTIIEKIVDKNNNVVYEYTNKQEQVLDPEAVSKLNQMMRYTATNGTATAANTIPNVMAIT